MADHDVDIGDDGNKKIKVLPGKIVQPYREAAGKTIEFRVKKHARATLFFPSADKLFVGQPKDLVQPFPENGKLQHTFNPGPPIGTYQYAVYWEDNNGKGQFAEGSSPPEVIIE